MALHQEEELDLVVPGEGGLVDAGVDSVPPRTHHVRALEVEAVDEFQLASDFGPLMLPVDSDQLGECLVCLFGPDVPSFSSHKMIIMPKVCKGCAYKYK